ncbi:MAG: hypothetical protein ACPK85_13650 [Methanosarcina sp.]
MELGNGTVKTAIANVLKRLDVAYVDDTTYKRLINIGLQYDYIETELLEQMLKTELFLFLGKCYSENF